MPAHYHLRRLSIRFAVVLLVATALFMVAIPTLERSGTFQPARWTAAEPWVLPANSRELWFDTADGVRLHGWLLHSPIRPAIATVLYSHGNGGHLAWYVPALELLRAQGVDILVWDYRGYGRSDGSSSGEASLYADAEAALQALGLASGLTSSQIVQFGYSLGTVAATELAVRHGCRALVLQAPLASMRGHILSHMPWMPGPFLDRLQNRFETASKIGRAACPIMVAHGDSDEAISIDQGRAVYSAAGEPKEWHVLAGGRHALGTSLDRQLMQRTADFLKRLPAAK